MNNRRKRLQLLFAAILKNAGNHSHDPYLVDVEAELHDLSPHPTTVREAYFSQLNEVHNLRTQVIRDGKPHTHTMGRARFKLETVRCLRERLGPLP